MQAVVKYGLKVGKSDSQTFNGKAFYTENVREKTTFKHLLMSFIGPRINTEREQFPQYNGVHPTITGRCEN